MAEYDRDWPARDDPPNWREYEPERPGMSLWAWALLVVLVASVAGYYFWQQRQPAPSAITRPPVVAPAPEAETPAAEKPAIRHPVPDAEAEPEKPLPGLDQSDTLIGDRLAGLVGLTAFKSFVSPEQLVRRIVATVDNLPRKIAPVRMRPVRPVPGQFLPGAGNRTRYAAHVKVFESLDARALVQAYVKLYPLFQSAYVELGHPDGYFNDRLVEAIDDMLAAPELAGAPELVQPKVLYLYADPGLEGRSAGQKIMMRLGREDAVKVKAKLREIRSEVTAFKG